MTEHRDQWSIWLQQAKPVIAVIVIDDINDAVPLAQALVAGGVHLLEITLRTVHGLSAIEQIKEQVPNAIVGAGTITTVEQFAASIKAGADFVVSPGTNSELLSFAKNWNGAYLPGVATASEVMQAAAAGFKYQKFFPAEVAGGVAALKALAGPFADIQFCPTGGISLDNAQSYLALDNVFTVGGSWLTPKESVAAKNWLAITHLAKQS